MAKLIDGLTPTAHAFIPAFIASGLNGTRAYLKIKPHVSHTTAQVESSKLLSDPMVKDMLAKRFNKQADKSIASRTYLTTEAHEIGIQARDNGQLGTALSAVELKGKLNRIFTDDVPETEGYKTLMQTLIVNVNSPEVQPKDIPGEVIDND
jgi:hypothetical protein